MSGNGLAILMVTVLRRRTVMPSQSLALVGVGTVVVLGVERSSALEYSVPGPDGKASESSERSMPQATSSAVIGLAVLPRRVVTDGERPLGEVLVGRAEVGREVGDQHHLAGVVVAGVLGQRPVRERLLDRVARARTSRWSGRGPRGPGRPAGSTVMVPPAVAPSTSAAGPWRSASLAMVSEASWTPYCLSASAAALVVVPAAATTGSEGHERGAGGDELPAALVRFMLSSLSFLFAPPDSVPGDSLLTQSASAAGLGVDGVANRVAEEVEGEHQGDDAEQGLPQVEGVVARSTGTAP